MIKYWYRKKIKIKELAVIITKEKSRWILYNKTGTKVLGKFRTKKEALEREKEINYFKNKGGKK